MAEKIPKPHTEKVEAKEKPTGDITTPDDKTEGFEETGYGSAPGSSDIMSGAESSVWTSDDHGPEDARIQQELKVQGSNLEAASGDADVSTKPAGAIKKTTSKKPKLGFFKKASPVPKLVESTAELTENLIPPDEEDKTKSSTRKSRSRSKFTSGLPKLVSLRKTRSTDKYRSCSPKKKEKDPKTSPRKSPVRKLSGIPTSANLKKQRLMTPSSDEEHGKCTEKEKAGKRAKSPKSAPTSKAKPSVQDTSAQSEYSEVPSQTVEFENAGECSTKSKRAPKFSLRKFKSTKQDAKVETPRAKQSCSTETKTDSTSATSSAYAFVRKGIKKMDVSGKLKKGTKKPEKTCLIEEDKAAKAVAKQGKESSEVKSYNDPYVFRETSWKPKISTQEGGLLDEEMIACISSSEKDTTPTEMSTLSDPSSLIRGRSRSQRSRHRTLDSLSKVSSFEEEVEDAAGLEGDTRPPLQRQTNVPEVEMDLDSGDVFDSPKHEVTPGKKFEDETDE